MATIVDGKRKIPFLRGMLTHYLLEQGVPFKEAYEVADRIRTSLQKKKTVPAAEMVHLVHETAREVVGDRPIGDGMFWAPGSRQILVEDQGSTRPFSREHLSRSLAVAGIDEEETFTLSERVAADFVQAGRTTVTRADLRDAAMTVLEQEYGRTFAERYEVWHGFRSGEQSRPLIVLIGGASGVGKTSVSVALANQLQISRVASTDEIRQVMRLMIAPDLMPTLHVSSYEAWKALPPSGSKRRDAVIEGYREQAARVCVGVRATIERALVENESLVLDGVHLLPDLLGVEDYGDQARFIGANLFLGDARTYRDRFRLRGQEASRRSQHRYEEHLDQILAIQDHILELGEEHRIPAYENSELDDTAQSISTQIMDALRRDRKGKKR